MVERVRALLLEKGACPVDVSQISKKNGRNSLSNRKNKDDDDESYIFGGYGLIFVVMIIVVIIGGMKYFQGISPNNNSFVSKLLRFLNLNGLTSSATIDNHVQDLEQGETRATMIVVQCNNKNSTKIIKNKFLKCSIVFDNCL